MQHGWLIVLLTEVIVMILFISEFTLAAFGVALHAFGVTFWGLWAQFDVFGST